MVSGVNPKLLYTKLVPQHALDEEFLRRMRNYKCASGTFRMNVALSELPDFTCAPGKHAQDHHKSGIILAPSLHYMEQAYFDARTLGCSRKPIIEILIPSTVDGSLAPPGRHVASLFCQHFNPVLPNGLNWNDIREPAADLIIDAVTQYAPNFKASVLGRTVLSPLDLESRFGLTGGDIFHGTLTLDQLWSARPLLGHGAYRGPYDVGKLFQFRGLAEYLTAQHLAVDLAVGRQHFVAKGCYDLRVCGHTRVVDLMAEDIGVNDMRALLFQKSRGRRFAGGDAASKTDDFCGYGIFYASCHNIPLFKSRLPRARLRRSTSLAPSAILNARTSR